MAVTTTFIFVNTALTGLLNYLQVKCDVSELTVYYYAFE